MKEDHRKHNRGRRTRSRKTCVLREKRYKYVIMYIPTTLQPYKVITIRTLIIFSFYASFKRERINLLLIHQLKWNYLSLKVYYDGNYRIFDNFEYNTVI